MAYDISLIPGAKWWRFDFHAHTPASLDYKQTGIMAAEWLLAYMRAEIDCVAVTDHNATGWISLLMVALEKLERDNHPEFRPLTIFPGFELTVAGGYHVLGLFDPTKSPEEISGVIGACEYVGTPGDSDTVSGCSIEKVLKTIAKRDGIAIPAHVDGNKGLWDETDHMTMAKILKLECLYAVEKNDTDNSDPALVNDLKKELSYVVGSDGHRLSDIGSRYCWVKMEKPNKEGLRLALLDYALSVIRYDSSLLSGNPNQIHSEKYIEGVEIVNAQFFGRGKPFFQALNPWMNSFIGGRGTGKSSLLEFVRIGCCRDSELEGDGYKKLREEFSKYMDIRAERGRGGLCTNDTVFSIFYRNIGSLFRIEFSRRHKNYRVCECDHEGKWELLEAQDIANRFPIKVYSQKQVYQIAEEPQALLRIIDESSLVDKLNWESEWIGAKTSLSTSLQEISSLRAALDGERRLQGELVDVERKLKLFENDENAEILKTYQRSRKQIVEILRWIQDFNSVHITLDKAYENLGMPSFMGDNFKGESDEEMIEIATSFNSRFTIMKTEVLKQVEYAKTLSLEIKKAVEDSKWNGLQKGVKNQYDELVKDLEKQGVANPDEYNGLVEKRDSIEEKLGALKAKKEELEKQLALQVSQVETIQNMRNDLTCRRNKFIDDTIGDNDHVQIEITPFGDFEHAVESLRSVLRLDDGVFEKQVFDKENGCGLLNKIYDENQNPKDDFLTNLELLKDYVRSVNGGDEDATSNLDKRFLNRVQKLTTSDLLSLAYWYPEDSLEVSYKSAAKRWESISYGSPGQKTAAILAFLLSYGDEPLLLDQPEDDLDNQLISSLIVSQLIANKARRQLVVITHNPNIVVNGDSELVVALDSKKGQTMVRSAGGLQNSEVRTDICKIMEGGDTAFAKRYRRIIQP
ncbi:MAG: TrlF family AAA-like ATPase [Desulfovibrio sp.]